MLGGQMKNLVNSHFLFFIFSFLTISQYDQMRFAKRVIG